MALIWHMFGSPQYISNVDLFVNLTTYRENWIQIQAFNFKKMHFKISSADFFKAETLEYSLTFQGMTDLPL